MVTKIPGFELVGQQIGNRQTGALGIAVMQVHDPILHVFH